MLRYKIGTQFYRIENLKNGGHHHGTSLPCLSMGVHTPAQAITAEPPYHAKVWEYLPRATPGLWGHGSVSFKRIYGPLTNEIAILNLERMAHGLTIPITG